MQTYQSSIFKKITRNILLWFFTLAAMLIVIVILLIKHKAKMIKSLYQQIIQNVPFSFQKQLTVQLERSPIITSRYKEILKPGGLL